MFGQQKLFVTEVAWIKPLEQVPSTLLNPRLANRQMYTKLMINLKEPR